MVGFSTFAGEKAEQLMQAIKQWLWGVLVIMMMGGCSEDDISGTVKRINEIKSQLPKYQKSTLYFDNIGDKTGVLDGYFEDGKLVTACLTTHGVTKGEELEFFFENGKKLLASYQTEVIYNKPTYYTQAKAIEAGDSVWHDPAKSVRLRTEYYYYGDRMVLWKTPDGKTIPDSDKLYERKTKKVLADADKIVQMLSKEAF
ncbi:MAG: hypothetical protein EBX41_06140 [Chitinophagia bacterium]|nr:hypothetical protein [Chitinophagia bacterium]